jgi:4-amino-4-deoxy-L-arabinose transferase-like glycosyltransferase
MLAAALAVAAASWAVIGSAWIFPQLSANSDEGVYLLQADALARGHLAPPAPAADADVYLPWFAVERHGSYVLKYTPVHAAVIAGAESVFGSPRAALALIAAANVLLVIALARELGAGRRSALVAGALFLASPLVIQLSITYLAYGTSLALLLAAATAALRAARTAQPAFAAAAGIAWGFAVFARPYDALLGGIAIVAAVTLSRPRRRSELVRVGLWAGAGAVAPLLALLAFNHAMTGDALRLPFNLLESRDRPGFGLRRALPTDQPIDYTVTRAFSALGRNLLLVSAWTGGGLLACGLGIATLFRRQPRRGAFLAAILIVWPLGYLFFWGSYLTAYVWDGALFLGPYYYLPMIAAVAIAAAVGLVELWDWRPAIGAAAAALLLGLSAAVAIPALADQRDRTSQRAAVADAIHATVRAPAVVFVPPLYGPWLQNPFSFLRNRAEIGGDTVFALDRGDAANARVVQEFPHRAVYRLEIANGWSDQPGFVPQIEITRVSPSPQ